MTKTEKLEMRQEELRQALKANAKELNKIKRIAKAEADKKAREDKIKKALDFYDHCMNNDIIFQNGGRQLLYEYAMRVPVEPHAR